MTGVQTCALPISDRVRGLRSLADDYFQKPVRTEELLARVESAVRHKRFFEHLESADRVIMALGEAVEARDSATHGHCQRLANLGEALGRWVGLSQRHSEALQRGGYLHDIGKIAVPDAVLRKPGVLSPDEQRLMRQHPAAGAEIIRHMKSLELVVPIVLCHHERLDGSGYPSGLSGAQIPVTALVIQVVDIYDALRTARSYKPPMPHDEAMAVLREEASRGRLHPELVDAFSSLLREHPEMVPGPLQPPALV